MLLRTSSGAVSLYVYNGTGSPFALLRSGGGNAYTYDYDPYGVPSLTASSGGLGTTQNPFLFKGGIQDRATGWVHYGNRWYNPTLGRWTQQDTLDTPLNPANANRHAYAAADPLNNADPFGYDCASAIAGVTFGALALAAGIAGLVVQVGQEAEIGLLAGSLAAGGVIFGAPDALIGGTAVAAECG